LISVSAVDRSTAIATRKALYADVKLVGLLWLWWLAVKGASQAIEIFDLWGALSSTTADASSDKAIQEQRRLGSYLDSAFRL
jgi:hypothetical protein